MQTLENRNLELTKKRWQILIVSCFINLCIGCLYAWSVFAKPMGIEIGATDLALVFTVANAVGPITMIPGGKINDMLGPKWVIFVGGLLFGGGMFFSGFAQSVSHLILTYSLGCGLGLGLVYGCTIGNSVKFFPDKRGMIGGIVTASFGISSVLIPPVANAITQQMGVRNAFLILGAIFTVVICAGAFIVRPCPADFLPTGFVPKESRGNTPTAIVNKDWRAMIADPIFYVMLTLLTCGGIFGLMVISCASQLAQNMIGLPVATAALFVSILALFNTAGRIVAGTLSDRIGRINTLSSAIIIALVGLACLYFAGTGSVALFFVGMALIGLCFGTFMGVFPGFTADQFGPKNNTVNYGIMWIGFSMAGIVGPTIVSKVLLATESYKPAFLIAGALALLGFVMTLLYRKLNKN